MADGEEERWEMVRSEEEEEEVEGNSQVRFLASAWKEFCFACRPLRR